MTDRKFFIAKKTRQYNQGTMLPIAENLSVYIVSSFEIRQYSCIPRLHKRKNFLAMGWKFCKKTVLLSGAARRARNTGVLWAEGALPITAPFLQKSTVPWLYCLNAQNGRSDFCRFVSYLIFWGCKYKHRFILLHDSYLPIPRAQ